jgi:hypothetical protein
VVIDGVGFIRVSAAECDLRQSPSSFLGGRVINSREVLALAVSFVEEVGHVHGDEALMEVWRFTHCQSFQCDVR